MTSKPKTRTYVVTASKRVYADVIVELPEEGFSAEFAVTTAMNDLHGMLAEDAVSLGALTDESDWRFESVDQVEGQGPSALRVIV